MRGIVCSLDVRIAHVDADGVPTGGFIGILNPVKLAINTPDPDRQQRVSKLRDSFGQALDEIITPKPTELELSTDDTGDAEVLAWALNGSAVGFTQTGGAIVDEVMAASKGNWKRLANRGVSAVVVKNTAGSTTYVANTDYLVDAVSGFIKVTDGGAITDGQSLKVSYTAAALTGDKISAGTNPSIFVQVDGEGINVATGKAVHVVIPRASLSASGSLDMVGKDFLVTALKGSALKVTGREVAEVTYLD
jgi:hypothetical protein